MNPTRHQGAFERPYQNGTTALSEEADPVAYFTGVEVERTDAYQHSTLFCALPPDNVHRWYEEIIYELQKSESLAGDERLICTHVYLGANRSLEGFPDWNALFVPLAALGLNERLSYVTVDLSYPEYALRARSALSRANDALAAQNKERKLIVMVSVDLTALNGNAVLKLDEEQFGGERQKGVYCWKHRALLFADKPQTRFTPWSKYGEDRILTRASELEMPRAAY